MPESSLCCLERSPGITGAVGWFPSVYQPCHTADSSCSTEGVSWELLVHTGHRPSVLALLWGSAGGCNAEERFPENAGIILSLANSAMSLDQNTLSIFRCLSFLPSAAFLQRAAEPGTAPRSV